MSKNIRLFITNDFITTLGDGIFSIILMWHVYETTGSALYTAIIGTIGHVTSFFIGPIAGVIADRSKNPLKLLIRTLHFNTIVVIVIVLSIYFLSNIYEAVSILILIFLRESLFSLQYPSQTRVIPKIVETQSIQKLIGYRSVTSSVASIMGNSLAGFVISTIGIIGGLMFNSVTFFAATIILSFLTIIKSDSEKGYEVPPSNTFKADFLDGIKFLWQKKEVRIIAIVSCLLNVSSMVGPMFVVYFNDFIESGPEFYGIFNAVLAIGSIIAGLTIGKISKFAKNVLVIIIGWSILSLSLIAMYFQVNVAFLIIIGFVLGFSMTLPNITLSTIEITVVPDNYRGRVSTAIQSISVSLIPIANILGGIIADIWDVNYVFLIAGIWQFLIVLLVIKYRRVFNT